jgi:thioredoxin 1
LDQNTEGEILFDETNFDEMVLKSSIPVVVDFSAIWCSPCIKVGKILDEIKSDYKGKLSIGKVDLDISKDMAEKYKVESIPVILIFKNGKQVVRIDGMKTKEFYIRKFNSIL